MNEKQKFYSLENILLKNADYNIIFGERSNGKTYAGLKHILTDFCNSNYKKQGAILRRWKEDIKGKRAETLFQPLIENGEIEKATNGKYTTVIYANARFYLAYYDDKIKKYVPCETPLAFCFALSEMEHDKSTSYPNVTNIVFDEFLTRRYYLQDEFMLFMNCISTIVRHRDNVKIFMFGNTVNKYCPYFSEMGLNHVQKMEQGTIDVYKFGGGKLRIAVEYVGTLEKKKKSNKYFCFDNSSAEMIVNGAWELAIYPHLNIKYKAKDIIFTYFIEFAEQVLQAEIINTGKEYFTYIHEKTTPIKNPDKDLIYSLTPNEKPNYKRRLISTATALDRKVSMFFATEKVFFQNNEIGEVVRNYIQQSTKNSIV